MCRLVRFIIFFLQLLASHNDFFPKNHSQIQKTTLSGYQNHILSTTSLSIFPRNSSAVIPVGEVSGHDEIVLYDEGGLFGVKDEPLDDFGGVETLFRVQVGRGFVDQVNVGGFAQTQRHRHALQFTAWEKHGRRKVVIKTERAQAVACSLVYLPTVLEDAT